MRFNGHSLANRNGNYACQEQFPTASSTYSSVLVADSPGPLSDALIFALVKPAAQL